MQWELPSKATVVITEGIHSAKVESYSTENAAELSWENISFGALPPAIKPIQVRLVVNIPSPRKGSVCDGRLRVADPEKTVWRPALDVPVDEGDVEFPRVTALVGDEVRCEQRWIGPWLQIQRNIA